MNHERQDQVANPRHTEHTAWLGPDFRAYLGFCSKVVRVLAIFALITLPLFGAYNAMLQSIGECLTTSQLAQLSRGRPFLWSSPFHHCGLLRPGIAAHLEPRVAIIGSSRVMQFRAPMFARIAEGDFYVAGTSGNFTLPCLEALRRLTRSERPPELVMFGLDFWFFKSAVPPSSQSRDKAARWLGFETYRWCRELRNEGRTWATYLLDRVQLYQEAWRDPRLYQALAASRLDPATGRRLWGVQSRLSGDGYRNDGSFRYGTNYRRIAREGLPEAAIGIDWYAKKDTFAGNYLNTAAFDDLREFIAECKAHNVRLVLFLPPIYAPALESLRRDPDTALFWQQFPQAIDQLCRAETVPFFDYTEPKHLLAHGGNFFDWYHPSEKLCGRMLLDMCNDPRTGTILREYVDRRALAQTIQAAGDGFALFDD